MIKWVEVLRRIMSLYNVKTQQDLGMALGVPVAIGIGESPNTTIPWPILELVVAEKKVSWDWLLTGREFRPKSEETNAGDKKGDTSTQSSTEDAAAATADATRARTPGMRPYLETRELERRLLERDNYREPEPENPSGPNPQPDASDDAIIRELEEIRHTMRKEMDRVSRLLEERRRR